MELLQCTTPLPGGSGQCNFCNALPHCPGALGSATPAMQCLTAWGQWTVQLLQCTASLLGGSGLCNSCNALPHRLGAVGSETFAMHCRTAWGQWAVDLLQSTASLPGAVGSAIPAMHCLTARGQWAVDLLQHTAPLPWGSGQWTSCNTPPHCLGAVGNGPPGYQVGHGTLPIPTEHWHNRSGYCRVAGGVGRSPNETQPRCRTVLTCLVWMLGQATVWPASSGQENGSAVPLSGA